MIGPGVNMERQTTRRERTGLLQIVAIGIVLAAALWGGLTLLAKTHAAWDAREAKKATDAARIAATAPEQERENRAARLRYEMAKSYAEDASDEQVRRLFRQGKLKCVHGVLFRKIDNGWENVPGAICEKP
jgi:hypothetical protein